NTNGTFTYTPDANANGTDSFTFKAGDGTADSNSATVAITNNPVNDPPMAQAATFTTEEDTVLSGQLNATDIDGDTLSYALVDLPGNGTVTINTNGTFTYTPSGNTNGTDTFTFKAGDGTTDSNTATVSMTINAVNDVPIADNQSISAVAGSTISGLLTGADPDGDNLTFAMTAAATQGDVTINIDGSFTYTARQDAAGSDSFTFTANDGVSNSTPATVTIAITENTIGFQFELHELQVDSSWQSLSYDSPFTNPVVIARASSFTDSETGVVRVKNITGAGMELRFQEWDSLDDQHPPETITVMVVEAGSFTLDDGTMIEAGCFSASGASGFSAHSFQLSMSTPPVVMTAVDTMNETDAVTTRIRNITTDGFEFMMREQEINAAAHAEETACYLAWEPSTGSLGNMQYEVAVTGDTITDNAYPISYGSRFIELPIILAAMQTTDGGDTAVLRINTGTIEGMNVRVSEEQSRDSETAHTTERGGYIAIANFNPAGDPDGDALVTADEENIYNTHPGVADTDHDGIDDGAEIAYWQDHGDSWDNDIDNDGLINILDPDADNDGMVDGSEIAAGFDPADPASVPTFPIMEGGEVDVDSSWLHVDFSGTFTKPVIIARLAGKNNSEPCVVRIDNVRSTGFDLRLQEYGYLDGIHSIEQVSYLVMEAGHYTMADGTQIEAGTFSTNATSSYDGRVFSRTFSQTPVVITSVSSTNEADTVTARIRKIDGNGFECRLQEQESNTRSHLTESLAYIAWEPSNGSENGLRYEVGRSADTVTHTPTTLNYTTGFSGKPLLYTDMQTTDGGDTSSLRTLSNEAATLQVQVEEEQSRDTEIAHTTEVAGFIAILSQ
ncbi:MAG TPA: tandem-95 repeat protein, partial [Desulfobulbus sp.]|nr:tandem-95 repeat protein [Desulfobulbus sp.]